MSDTMMTFMKYALIFCITGVVMCIGFLFGYMEGFKDCKHKDQINKHFFKKEYETRLKANMVAMLEEIRLEATKMKDSQVNAGFWEDYDFIIRQKINSLKENTDDARRNRKI